MKPRCSPRNNSMLGGKSHELSLKLDLNASAQIFTDMNENQMSDNAAEDD